MKKALADAIAQKGYETLTPVQEAVTNPDLVGADLLVSAQTGSGKTVGFGIAIAPVLLGEAETFDKATKPLALVIAPTRELAMQVKRELAWLYAQAGAVLASCVGGMDMRDERRALNFGAHIVVATPGRLRDHIMRGSIDLGEVRAVVLDEADEMLDLGFREDLEFILGEAPPDRQTLMFSATVPKAIANLAKSYQNNAVRISTVSERSQHADIDYRAMLVAGHDAENAIINVLRYYESPNAIVFGNTRAMVNRLTTRLSNRGFSVVALSGELSQSERTHALQAMRDGRARVCVATDVAARGIDLPNLDLVIHAELPTNHETLLHRSGRTGRAGRKGVSVLIVPPAARKKAERILAGAKLRAEWQEAPSAEAVSARDAARMMDDPVWWEPAPESDSDLIATLSARFSPEQLAAAYLRMYHSQHSAPEDLAPIDAKPRERAPFGPSAWFTVAGGRAVGAEPRRLLPMLCKLGGLTKEDIGAIRIQEDQSFVEILKSSVPAFLDAIGPSMTVEGNAVAATAAPGFVSAGFASRKPVSGKPAARKPYVRKEDRAPTAPRHDVSPARAETAAVAAPAPIPAPAPAASTAPPPKPKPRPRPEQSAYRPEATGEAPPPAAAEEPRKKKPRHKKLLAQGIAVPPAKGKSAGKPAGKPFVAKRHKADGPGLAPAVGKPSSKKNRARAAAAKGEGKPTYRSAGRPGGTSAPRRKP